MPCNICCHEHRKSIEDHLAIVDTPGTVITLREIAEKFKVDLIDLQVHALMHSSLVSLEQDYADGAGVTSIAEEMKKAEGNHLYQLAQEYQKTLRVTGIEIRSRLKPTNAALAGDPNAVVLRGLPKEMVDLYIGAGNNLRQTISTIVDMNQKINGEADPALEALSGLVHAIKGSTQRESDD